MCPEYMLPAQLLGKSDNTLALLQRCGLLTTSREYKRRRVIVSQGSRAETLFFLQEGVAKVSIVSNRGKVAVLGVLSSGSLFGQACLTAPAYTSSVEALVTCSVVPMPKHRLLSAIRDHPEFTEFLLAYFIERNLRIEEDLLYQLCSSSEWRLAHILVRMSDIGEDVGGEVVLPGISQETLAQMVGTTRSRVNFFLNKFMRQGLIHYDRGLHVHHSLAAMARDHSGL